LKLTKDFNRLVRLTLFISPFTSINNKLKQLKLNSVNKMAFCNKENYNVVFNYASQHGVM